MPPPSLPCPPQPAPGVVTAIGVLWTDVRVGVWAGGGTRTCAQGQVKDWQQQVIARARKDGYTRTLMGRYRELPLINSSSASARGHAARAAINTPIQGGVGALSCASRVRAVRLCWSGRQHVCFARARPCGWVKLVRADERYCCCSAPGVRGKGAGHGTGTARLRPSTPKLPHACPLGAWAALQVALLMW
jgi:hypothetical protein